MVGYVKFKRFSKNKPNYVREISFRYGQICFVIIDKLVQTDPLVKDIRTIQSLRLQTLLRKLKKQKKRY